MMLVMILASPMVSVAVSQGPGAAVAVDINAATVEELQSLPDIGKVMAERIVAYRTANGNFASPEDLVKVKGIGEKKLEKIRGLVTVE